MAKNIKINNYPELYQSETRKPADVKFEELKDVNQNFEGYTPQVGDIYRFPVLEEMKFKSQPVRSDGRGRVYFVGAQRERNGVIKDTWLNLGFLAKQDVNREAVNPTWYDLGNAQERVKALAKMGEIRATGVKKINVAVFDRATNRNKVVETLDPATGKQMIDEFGTAMTHIETRSQDAVVVTPYVEAAAQ
ncbi:MAG: hypothetical protein IKF58_05800 [Bacillus sp. (in: Bacteria)]|nr:hypothetical protein [Bacillus sp. (in: firmicutes)]